jgi:deoxyribonuclease-4
MPQAVPRAIELGATAIQIFVQNQQQWRGRMLGEVETLAFRRDLVASTVRHTLAHGSYLANLGSPDDILFERSRAKLLEEMQSCAALGVGALVIHPGSHAGSGEADGLRRIASGLRWLLAQPGLDAAGDLAGVHRRARAAAWGIDSSISRNCWRMPAVGVHGSASASTPHICSQRASIFAPRAATSATFAEFERIVGLANLRGFHLNDSKLPTRLPRRSSRRIGAGYIGSAAFGRLIRDPRFAGMPMVLETPGGQARLPTWPAAFASDAAGPLKFGRDQICSAVANHPDDSQKNAPGLEGPAH